MPSDPGDWDAAAVNARLRVIIDQGNVIESLDEIMTLLANAPVSPEWCAAEASVRAMLEYGTREDAEPYAAWMVLRAERERFQADPQSLRSRILHVIAEDEEVPLEQRALSLEILAGAQPVAEWDVVNLVSRLCASPNPCIRFSAIACAGFLRAPGREVVELPIRMAGEDFRDASTQRAVAAFLRENRHLGIQETPSGPEERAAIRAFQERRLSKRA